MNDRFALRDLEKLIDYTHDQAVSIYLPTHPVSTHIDEDILYLKNALRDVENSLSARGMRSPDVRKMLQPATDLLENNLEFWQNQSHGLAIFLGPNFHRQYRLPVEFNPRQQVAQRFHIKPLLPLFTGDGTFYILAVSQNQVRLLRGTRYVVDELDPQTLPTSLADALRFDEIEKQLQHHTTQPSRTESGGAIFHGHGGGATNDDKDRILRYFQQIDDGLRDYLTGSHAPLVFAGVDYLAPIYRQAGAYPHLVEDAVAGNPDQLSAQELHAAAWELVAPIFAQEQTRALERYQTLTNTGQTSVNIAELLPAAFQGRVDTALVAHDREITGVFDPDRDGVHLYPDEEDAPDSAAYDLTDRFAVYTLLRGGEVFVIDPSEMPGGVPAAAIYRY
jgi:hypothetical protein